MAETILVLLIDLSR